MNRWLSPQERRDLFFSQLVIDPSGCVLWTGYCDESGYGQVSYDGRQLKVHRVMYEMFEGPIPDDLQLDHVKERGCAHKNCANVAHLEPVTNQENSRRANTIQYVNAAETSCDAGHEFDEKNTYYGKDGARYCRACGRDRARRYRRDRAAGRPPDPDPGRRTRGERNGRARLTETAVLDIRLRFANRTGSRSDAFDELAQAYGISTGTVRSIVYRQSWKHLPSPTCDGRWVDDLSEVAA